MIVWPLYLRPREVSLPPGAPARFGPQPIYGPPMAVANPSAFWQIRYDGLSLAPGKLVEFETLALRMAGGVEKVAVSPFRFRHTPRARARMRTGASVAGVPFLGSGVAWSQAPYAGEGVDFRISLAAVQGVTVIEIERRTPGLRIGYDYISLGSGEAERLHRIVGVGATDGDKTSIEIWPALRAAVAVNDPVNTEDPRCISVCSTPAPAANIRDDLMGSASLEFIEADW